MPSLLRNILFHLTNRGLLVILSLVSTPILVHRLGSEAYGVYVLSLTFGGLLGVLDLGLTPAVVRLLSAALHQEKVEHSQAIVSTALTLFLCLGLLGGALFALLVPWLALHILRIPGELQLLAQIALWLSTLSFALTMWLSVFNAIPIALERYDLLTKCTATISLVSTVLIIVCAAWGWSLVALMTVNVLATTALLITLYALSRFLSPTIHIRPGFDKTVFRELVRFSAFKFVGSLSSTLVFRVDQFVLGAMLGVQAVSLYAVPANVALRVASLLGELVSPLFPRIGKLRDNEPERRRLFLRSSRMMALVAGLTLTTLFILGDSLLRLWIGGDQGEQFAREGGPVMRWLLAAFYIQSIAAVPILYCEALGKPEINNTLSAAAAIAFIPLLIILVPLVGLIAPALALFLVSAVITVGFIIYASRQMAQVSLHELMSVVIAPPLGSALITAAVGSLIHPYIHTIVTLALAGAILVIVYLTSAVILRAFKREDFVLLFMLAERMPMWIPGRSSILRWRHAFNLQPDLKS
ncbi:MAG: oligosaccharide flippase family protein [Anaerolineae bacterium]|nr:oligosaccharide flippase family protein [Anaerolineae bacterium]